MTKEIEAVAMGDSSAEITVKDLDNARRWLSQRWCVDFPNEGHVRQLAKYMASFQPDTLSRAAPKPVAGVKPFECCTSPISELRISLIARAVRQSLRKYGHKIAESVLPECIAGDVEHALNTCEHGTFNDKPASQVISAAPQPAHGTSATDPAPSDHVAALMAAPERLWLHPEHGMLTGPLDDSEVEYARVSAVNVRMEPPADLRKRVMRAIFDPGATEGFKGKRDLTTWQTDAVMKVLREATAYLAPDKAPRDWQKHFQSLRHALSAASQDLLVAADLVRNKQVSARLLLHCDTVGGVAHALDNPSPARTGLSWENPSDPTVKLFVGFDVESYVEEYEFCGEGGDYSPNEQERMLLVDAIYGVVANLHEELRKLIPSSPSPAPNVVTAGQGVDEMFRHKKRGTTYTVIARGRLQVDADLDNEKVVIYRGDDGQVWVRPEYEFNDGRFEALVSSEGTAE